MLCLTTSMLGPDKIPRNRLFASGRLIPVFSLRKLMLAFHFCPLASTHWCSLSNESSDLMGNDMLSSLSVLLLALVTYATAADYPTTTWLPTNLPEKTDPTAARGQTGYVC